MAATGWHGVGNLSAAHRLDVLIFVLCIIGTILLLTLISRRTNSEEGFEDRQTPPHNARYPGP
jgi:hypothetical protein